MNVLLFGATGMVGQGVLRECLLDPDVSLVQTLGRTAAGIQHPKLTEIVHADLFHYDAIQTRLTGFDACFFCLGISSSGMKEEEYASVTYSITLAAAEVLSQLNPKMTFIYVSGQGTDSSERGRIMWARVKGRTENALLKLPFAAAYMFRPGLIQPLHGIKSKTALYRAFYSVLNPVIGLMHSAFPKQVLTTEEIGKAMLLATKGDYPKRVLETKDIRALLDRK